MIMDKQPTVETSHLEVKDSLDAESANATKVTSAQVHFSPGIKNPRELPNQIKMTGESKECAIRSRSESDPAIDIRNEAYTCHLFKQAPMDKY